MAKFEEDLEGNLRKLQETIKAQGFEPHPVRRTYIQEVKAGGRIKMRPLGIPVIRDRIVQAAVAQVLEAIYEPLFRKYSYGFRPRRNTIQALRHVAQAYRAGATWIIEGDLVKCLDRASCCLLQTLTGEDTSRERDWG